VWFILQDSLSLEICGFEGNKKWEIKISPITGLGCPEGSRKLRFPDYVKMAQDGGKVVSLTYWSLLPLANTPGTHIC